MGFNAIAGTAPFQGLHAFEFQFIRSHQQLAALPKRQLVRTAKCHGLGSAALAEIGLQTAGLIIDAGMDDAGIAAGLVPGQAIFLFKQQDIRIRVLALQLPGRGNADDAAPDNYEIKCAQ